MDLFLLDRFLLYSSTNLPLGVVVSLEASENNEQIQLFGKQLSKIDNIIAAYEPLITGFIHPNGSSIS